MNVVSITGALVRDPEFSEAGGMPECRLRIAVPRYHRNGQRVPGVVYVNVTTFGLEARDCAASLSKGSSVALSGRLDGDATDVLPDQLELRREGGGS
ncbi:MAG: single-stranded DNA-binding protein [Thermoleophilaceae bacterium]